MSNLIYWSYEKLREITFDFKSVTKGKTHTKELQNLITFDIETSNGFRQKDGQIIGFSHELYSKNHSLFDGEDVEQVSLMYVWQCAFERAADNNSEIIVFMGRTWGEFEEFMTELTDDITLASNGINPDMDIIARSLLLDSYKKGKKVVGTAPEIHIYIHNLGFEFQHLQNVFHKEFTRWTKRCSVFARKQRCPMRADFNYNRTHVILNDTLCLTQRSLASWTEDLEVSKLSEPKDFYLPVRTPETHLTDEEINYSVNDVVSMVYGLREYRDKYKRLGNIPMTQTGELRRVLEEKVGTDLIWVDMCKKVAESVDYNFYLKLYKAYMGGWTHANILHTNQLRKNVSCFDFRSSYPAVMTQCKFPISTWREISEYEKDMIDLQGLGANKKQIYFGEFRFTNVVSKTFNTFYSYSKAYDFETATDENGKEFEIVTLDNGKIYNAAGFTATMTDLDLDIFLKSYDCNIEVLHCWAADCDYLPATYINVILDYYGWKTSLKDVEGKEDLYAFSKKFNNGIYGVQVQKLINEEILYNADGWIKEDDEYFNQKSFHDTIKSMLKKNCYTMYQIGVWVSAWARWRLWQNILKFDEKVVYCDTDSIKGVFTDEEVEEFLKFNDYVESCIVEVCKARNIDINKFKPKTPKGVCKELGYFDIEDKCLEFKALHAKCYCDKIEKDGKEKIVCTVAGISKKACLNVVKSVDMFKDGLTWKTNESEKTITYYNDNQTPGTWVDRNGGWFYSSDKYGICLMPATFKISNTEDYKTLFNDIQSACDGEEMSIMYDRADVLSDF